MDWIMKYMGQRWTQTHDCGYWFRKIQEEQFGRNIPSIINSPGVSPRAFAVNACRTMKSLENNPQLANWTQTTTPVMGDAAMIALRRLPHHIGIVVVIRDTIHILHALEHNGVQLTRVGALENQNYRILSYWHYEN